MKFSFTCLFFGHHWHPWSFNGLRSRRFCARCGYAETATSKDMTK